MSRLRLFVTLRQPWLWMIDEVGSKVEQALSHYFRH